jgi:hypothetical protein
MMRERVVAVLAWRLLGVISISAFHLGRSLMWLFFYIFNHGDFFLFIFHFDHWFMDYWSLDFNWFGFLDWLNVLLGGSVDIMHDDALSDVRLILELLFLLLFGLLSAVDLGLLVDDLDVCRLVALVLLGEAGTDAEDEFELLAYDLFGVFDIEAVEEVFDEVASDLEDLAVLVVLVCFHGEELVVFVEFVLGELFEV